MIGNRYRTYYLLKKLENFIICGICMLIVLKMFKIAKYIKDMYTHTVVDTIFNL